MHPRSLVPHMKNDKVSALLKLLKQSIDALNTRQIELPLRTFSCLTETPSH